MNIDSIKNGIVIDHIQVGKGMEIYNLLELDKLDCSVAIIKNVNSKKMGRKDIIKIDCLLEMDMNILGYVDSNITINIIQDGVLVEKKKVELPKTITNVVYCKNPRCITSVEQELKHIFNLQEDGKYRCIYCESKAL
jgi:aspartate carbamoyltransferase regulatory subunit